MEAALQFSAYPDPFSGEPRLTCAPHCSGISTSRSSCIGWRNTAIPFDGMVSRLRWLVQTTTPLVFFPEPQGHDSLRPTFPKFGALGLNWPATCWLILQALRVSM